MKRPDRILVLLSLLALCLQGCGDEEKGDAMAKWAAFQTDISRRFRAHAAGRNWSLTILKATSSK